MAYLTVDPDQRLARHLLRHFGKKNGYRGEKDEAGRSRCCLSARHTKAIALVGGVRDIPACRRASTLRDASTDALPPPSFATAFRSASTHHSNTTRTPTSINTLAFGVVASSHMFLTRETS